MSPVGWRRTAAALGAALVIALVALVLVVVRTDGTDDGSAGVLRAAESAAEAAAREAVVHLTTYDYKTVDSDFDWANDAGTPAFQARYAEVSAPTKRYVTAYRVHAEGSVDQSAATAQDADHVTVLLFVDQRLTAENSTERKLATPRVKMSMVRSGDRWLVDDVAVRNLVSAE